MGKNRSKDKHNKNDEIVASTSKKIKSSKPQKINKKLESIIKSVGLPKNAEGLTADQLTENQKHVLKKVCTKMYGHQHSERLKMPATSLESASVQLAAKMKEKLAQRKKDKKKQKQTNSE